MQARASSGGRPWDALDGAQVLQQRVVVEVEPVGDGGESSGEGEGELGLGARLAVEEAGDGVDGVELVGLVGVELELHGYVAPTEISLTPYPLP